MPQLPLTALSKAAALQRPPRSCVILLSPLVHCVCDGLFAQIDTHYSNLWNVPATVRTGPGGLGWTTHLLPAPSPFSAWRGEGASVCGVPECVPVGMMTIPKAPSWAGLSLPVACDLQL